ncbi:MAG: triphosphoribosyl-dephospho-CoA synthase [Methylotenera sp.]|nr:triphosphoribosyl-dephospho-CoA synthase [Methylotenera sp.]
MSKQLTPGEVASCYRAACIAELQALKPGNVHLFADGHGMTIHDFIKSADASAEVISQANLSLGERIYAAVEATNQAVGLNTNLGVILLCAPLIHAALNGDCKLGLQHNLANVLAALTMHDADLTAQAIVMANPAGLGKADKHDVRWQAEVTLLEMMHSAQHKDRIAWQYVNHFSDVIGFGRNSYNEALAKWQNVAWATTALYLGFLGKYSDTHIVRKYGEAIAGMVMLEAKEMEVEFKATDNPKLVQKSLMNWDASLKKRGINPGTSADLTVASLLAYALMENLFI